MTELTRTSRRTAKGAPSGWVVSTVFHGVVFLLAGVWIVATVVHEKPRDPFIVTEQYKRPEMQLEKRHVRIMKNPRPKPSSRIVAPMQNKPMPQFRIPALDGDGKGLLDDINAGFAVIDMPDLKLTPFGYDETTTTGNDLVGRFYDFKRLRNGTLKGITPDGVDDILHTFMARGWSDSVLEKYYRAPRKLYTSCICIGTVQSTLAPEAFGETTTEGWAWAVLYRGKLVYPEDLRFRFRAVGDKFSAVRVDGRVVLLTAYNRAVRDRFTDIWYGKDPEHRLYPMAESKQAVGDWIDLKGGVPLDLEIILGDRQGGLVYHQLVVEVEGEEYPDNPFGGGPCLPVFKTDNLTRAQLDAAYVDVYPGDVNLTNGPVFCDIRPNEIHYTNPAATSPPPILLEDSAKRMRNWTFTSGEQLEGRCLVRAEDYVLLEMYGGRQQKVPYARLSGEDQRFLELINVPAFQIEYSKKSKQVFPTNFSPYDNGRPLSIFDYTYGAKLRWSGVKSYRHELTVEYFAIGEEARGDNLILLDHRSMHFVPAEAGKKRVELFGTPVRVMEYANRNNGPIRGTRGEGGYLITVSDEAGRIVQYKTSNEFLFENLAKLKRLPLKAYFDNQCNRQFPTRPDDSDRAPWILM